MPNLSLSLFARRRLSTACVLAAGAVIGGGVTSAEVATASGSPCSRYAAPGGVDTGKGTATDPYATVQKLVASTPYKRTGCLRKGSYYGDVSVTKSDITLTAYGTERAVVVGRFRVRDSANRVTIRGLSLDGRNASNLPSPAVYGDDVHFRNVDVSNGRTDICFMIGDPKYGRAYRTRIENSRIHDCGVRPETNLDHGVYVDTATDTVIRGNDIFDNASRGIKLGPDSQRAIVRGNVIDGNGQGVSFSGANGISSSNNTVENNVISNSRLRWNVESYWPSGTTPGTGNIVRGNCLWASNPNSYYLSRGGVSTQTGFSTDSNLVAEPQFVDRLNKDFRLTSSSPCRSYLDASA